MYRMWFDDSKKKTTIQKIGEGIANYRLREELSPTVVLTHESQLIKVEGMNVRSSTGVQKDTFWIGREP